MLSILGGAWSGRRLKALDREGLRPTSGRVKAAIFSILESIEWKRSGQPDFSHWNCLDLYAGVGGLGLEALSRGASRCVFVEKDRHHARALQENIRSLGCESQTEVLVQSVDQGDWKERGPFHLVLLDPPYAESYLPSLLESFGSGTFLAPGAIVLFEHDPKVRLGQVAGLTLSSERKLGPAGISVYLKD